jgi:solute carrier family 13 (sodium-dependent dicarboxylate transporter), member 2/3/5
VTSPEAGHLATATEPDADAAEAFVATSPVSEAEKRFDHARRTIGLFLGPLALLAVLAWPMPALSIEAHRLAAIVTLVMIWWVAEAIPIAITSLVGVGLATLFGVADATTVLAPFGNPVIFLFIGSFILGRAIAEHGVDRRISGALLDVAAVGGSYARSRLAVQAIVMAISAWISNAATTVMMLPVALGVLRSQVGRTPPAPGPVTTGMVLTVAFASSIGGMITPVGAAPNLITMGLLESTAGVVVEFTTWVLVALPVAIVMGIALHVAGRYFFPVPGGPPPAQPRELVHHPRNWTRGELNTALAFLAAVLLWVGPSVLGAVAPESGLSIALGDRLDEGIAAILAASLLFVLPVDWRARRFTLGWNEAAQIDWSTILLMGGGLSLGHLMFTTGLAEHLARAIVDGSGAASLWSITAVSIAIGVLLTEVTSNTSATAMLVPVVISICQAAGVNPAAPAIGVCLGASCTSMFPISTPANAIVYSTGLVPIRRMILFGAIMDVCGFLVILAGLRLLCPLLGLA